MNDQDVLAITNLRAEAADFEPEPGSNTDSLSASEGWFIKSEGGEMSAFYGPPNSDAGYGLECKAQNRTIAFISYGASSSSGNNIVFSAGRSQTGSLPVTFETDGMESGESDIPIEHPIFDELIEGASPLRASWDGGAIDILNNDKKLESYLKGCRGV